MSASISGIPLVDLSLYTAGNQAEKQQFVADLGKAFVEVGFVGVVNHGIPSELVKEFYNQSKQFFAQSDEVKSRCEVKGLAGQRGYTSFGKEHAKQSNVGDLKEFFQIGQTVPTEHALGKDYPTNVAVAEQPVVGLVIANV